MPTSLLNSQFRQKPSSWRMKVFIFLDYIVPQKVTSDVFLVIFLLIMNLYINTAVDFRKRLRFPRGDLEPPRLRLWGLKIVSTPPLESTSFAPINS